ncbi:hypothetical protein [Streptomyces sp. NPDC097610]|uniref:hypothetical protein n=1 Tax=Streptomyces sp. NPDC097610 TaxID=3157227 RepID=UPI00331E41BA
MRAALHGAVRHGDQERRDADEQTHGHAERQQRLDDGDLLQPVDVDADRVGGELVFCRLCGVLGCGVFVMILLSLGGSE